MNACLKAFGKFISHRHSGSGDIMFMIHHLISKGQVILRSYGFKGSAQVTSNITSHHLAKFGGHSNCGNRFKIVLVCHVIPRDHVTER